MIRQFIEEDTWDDVIRTAIAKAQRLRTDRYYRREDAASCEIDPGCRQAG